jgi:putative cell wall-binding protein
VALVIKFFARPAAAAAVVLLLAQPSTAMAAPVGSAVPRGTASAAASTVTPLPPGTHRLAGADRYATAVQVSSRYSPGVSKVYIATGVNYPDALSAAAVAGAEGVPLLLVLPTSIPPVVWDEVVRLQPAEIVIAGGPTTVSTAVATQLSSVAPVTRIAGADRFETSRMLAEQGELTGTTTYVATGLNFPDALSSAGAAGSLGSSVILVNGGAGSADSSTLSTLTTVGTTSIRIAGSSAAVSNGVANSLGATYPVSRYAGADRFETGTMINADAFDHPSTVYLALGTNFPDALAGGALAAATSSPLFIVQSTCVPTSVHAQIEAWSPSTIVLLGSEASLSSAVANLVECADPSEPPPPPSNPGDSVNCSDFPDWLSAQTWFNTYYPHYGDIANLDYDGDLIACESLPGAP